MQLALTMTFLETQIIFLHAHVFPRYATENTEYLSKPVWLYPSTYWSDKRFQYNPNRDDVIRKKITKALNEFL